MDPKLWVTNEKHCWEVGNRLDDLQHWPLVTMRQAKLLWRRDAIEREAGALRQHKLTRRR